MLIAALLLATTCQGRVIEVHVPQTLSEILTPNGIAIWIDYLCYELIGVPLRSPSLEYKAKHEDDKEVEYLHRNPFVQSYKAGGHGSHPRVMSLETWYKNNLILTASIGAVWGCWFSGTMTLFFDNDAGAYFVDCLTMWTQFVYFYKDEKSIQYSYV